jgi:hypothetical protein
MVGRKGLYEIIMVFFLIIVMVFSIMFFLSMNAGSSVLYSNVRQHAQGPREAVLVKDSLLACHRTDYLHADLFRTPCPADRMQQGYRVTQYEINGCAPETWGEAKGEFTQTIPFVVAVEHSSGKRCLAKLEVFLA